MNAVGEATPEPSGHAPAWKVGDHGRHGHQPIFVDGINRMQAQGLLKVIPPEAPEIELDEEFWRNARVVSTEAPRKTSVHLRIDLETFAFSHAAGKSHLTRTAEVLKVYAQRRGKPSEPVEN